MRYRVAMMKEDVFHFCLGRQRLRVAAVVGVLTATSALATPKLVVDEPIFDFGTRDNLQTIEHTFEVRNEGTSTLRLERIRSSCGCTVGQVTHDTLEPGETSRITAAYNLRGRRGTQHSTLTLETNDPNQPRAQLIMRGAAIEEIRVQPGHVFFGPVAPGEEVSRVVEVIGQPDQPFTLSGHEASLSGIRVEAETVSPHSYRLRVFFTPDQQSGLQNGELRIRTSHPRHSELVVALAAQITSGLTVAPRALNVMGNTTSPVTRYVMLQAPDGRDFEVTAVEAPVEDIHVRTLHIPGRGYRLQISNLLPLAELEDAALRIQTTFPNHEDIEIPFNIIHP